MGSKFLFVSFLILISSIVVSGRQFQIGGLKGWVEPSGNDTKTYDEWAEENRFHVGDSIYFKYQNDSVLEVNYTNFANCNIASPVSKFDNGNTVVRFNRYGYFYFISGKPGHCKSGQKVVIRVMVHPRVIPPNIAPSPQGYAARGPGGSGNWGPPSPNSTVRLALASYFLTALGGAMILLYLFM